uniref:Ig-like domain-containing protein n=1 Tax=Neogobius melanostomus TaxID=47308 RepID=A0A8C6V7U5_9GOBI
MFNSNSFGHLASSFATAFVYALYGYGFMSCQFISEGGHDALYTVEVYYNKQLFASYNSTEGKYRGYTERAKDITDGLNHNQHFLDQEKKNLELCRNGVSTLLTTLETAEPRVRVFSTKTANSHQPGIIICSAYNFYPKPITLTWLRNGEEVTSEVISTDEMSDGNWLYQKHSYLEYIPTPTDTIECMVEHASLPTPKLYRWEYLSESRINKITVGTAGLLLGLAFITAGAIYYMKHTKAKALFFVGDKMPTNKTVISVENNL